MSETVERRIIFEPGYNHRASGGGVHGMEIAFLMIAPRGAVHFSLSTGWVPGISGVPTNLAGYFPAPWDLGYHWPTPRYAGMSELPCDLLPSGRCFYDGSSLRARPILADFIANGEDAVWDALDNYYRSLVETEDDWLADAVESAGSL